MYKLIGMVIRSGKLNDPGKILNHSQKLAKKYNVKIQLFDARYIFGGEHIITAVEHAKGAFKKGENIADTLTIEILLYAAGEYQIKNAIAKLGLNRKTSEIAILVIGDDEYDNKVATFESITQTIFDELRSKVDLDYDDNVLEGYKKNLVGFGITESELSTTPEEQWFELVLEKVALVDIKK